MAIDRQHSMAALISATLFAAVFLLDSMSPASAETRTAPSAPVTVSVQLNWRHQFEFAAFYAAIEKGFYREEGLEVSLHEGGPGIDPVDEVASGSRDFGVANSSLVVEHAQGKPVIALAALMQHSAFALVARRDRGISLVTDLDGRRISCAAHACDEIRAYLRASGLPDHRVRYVSMRSADLDKELAENDAADIFVSNQGFQIVGRENEFILFLPRAAGIDLYGDILFTHRDKSSRDPQLVSAFRRATAKGIQYALNHREELIDLILARYNTQKKSRAHFAFEAQKLHELIRLDLVEPGYMSEGRWRHVRDVYASLGLVPADYPVEDMLYRDTPPGSPHWWQWISAPLLFALLMAAALAAYFYRLTTRLRSEVNERVLAEAALKAGQDQFSRFVEQANSLVAHEVRTPLSVLQVHLDLIEIKQSPDGGMRENLRAMKQALVRLQQIFERNLRQVFDSASTFSRQQPIDIGKALPQLVASHVELSGEDRFSVRLPDPAPVIRMAPEMFEPMITNLLENASKYSPAGSTVHVTVTSDGTTADIEVINASVLPPSSNPELLFAKHARGLGQTDTSGTGVGLYLVRLIVEAHAGSASIPTAAPGEFRIRLRLPCIDQAQHVSVLPSTTRS